jgi:RHS repeat-associated protein
VTSGGVTESYTYDADGERVTRTRSGVTTLYLEGLWEHDVGTSREQVYHTFNGATVVAREASDVTYLHADHLGSVSVSTGWSGDPPDASYQTFTPWGAPRSGSVSATKRNYTGQYRDDTGLLYYHARYYDPVLGRFISPDTLVPDPTDPQDLNRYTYAKNNPMRYTDPTGHRSCAAGACFEGGAQMGGPINPGAGSAGQAALNVGTVIVYVTQAGARVTDAVGEFVTAITSGAGAAAPDGASVGGAGELAGAAGEEAEFNEGNRVKVKDLDPLHSPQTSGRRPDLEKLSDRELLDTVTNPKNNDRIKINSKTGKVVDGNGRAYELKRRAEDPNSSITQDTKVPYEPYKPLDDWFFDDLP